MNKKSIVVDLDCSLLKIDLFKELIIRSLLTKPFVFLKTIFLLFQSKALSKSYIAQKFNIDFNFVPYNKNVLNILKEYRKKGFKIILATGANKHHAQNISKSIFNFDLIIASDAKNNCVGRKKLEMIIEQTKDQFIYIGDSIQDFPIWEYCKNGIIVGNNNSLNDLLFKNGVKVHQIIADKNNHLYYILRQLRIYQWSKNLLLFFPAIVTHTIFEFKIFFISLIGFLSFSCIASSIYIFNDILDIDNDRKHPMKKNRPFASGQLDLFSGYVLFLFFMGMGFWLGFKIGYIFIYIIFFYIISNVMYSFYLKKIFIVDILMLTLFYVLRLVAGNVQFEEQLSQWIISFSLFLFFSLGLLKRYIDLVLIEKQNIVSLNNRVYNQADKQLIMILGVCSGLIATLVIFLYSGSEHISKLYKSQFIISYIAPLFLFWISRMWYLGDKGEIKDDPVLFTIKDIMTYILIILTIIILIVSKYLTI